MLLSVDWQKKNGVSATTNAYVTVSKDKTKVTIDIPDNPHTMGRDNAVLFVAAVLRARGLRYKRVDPAIHDGLENILAIAPGSDIMGWMRGKRGVSNAGWKVIVLLDKP